MTSYVTSIISSFNPYAHSKTEQSSSSSSIDPNSSSSSKTYIDTSPLSRVPTAKSCFTDKQAKVTNNRYQNEKSLFSAPKGIKVSLLPGPKQAQKPNLIPDPSSSYFVIKVKMKQGWKLTLKGQYPHTRYLSYTIAGELGEGEVGNGIFRRANQIVPDEGSVNPFVPGTPRDAPNRNYTFNVVHSLQPEEPEQNTLYTGSDADELKIHFSSRNYLPDKNYDGTGVVMLDEEGYGLPDITLVSPEGKTFTGPILLPMLDANKDGDPNGFKLGEWEELVALSGDAENAPCLLKSDAELFWSTDYNCKGSFIKNPEKRVTECPPTNDGGFASNPDTKYLNIPYSLNLPSDPGNFPYSEASSEFVSSSGIENKAVKKSGFGDVLVVRGKMPTHPKTREGENSLPEDPQVQYFSAVTYGTPPSGQGFDGRCDEETPLNADKYYTYTVGTPWNRPKNTEVENGVSYLDIGHGEGYFTGARPGVGFLGLRYMAPSLNWAQSPANVPMPSQKEPIPQERIIMDEFYPESCYMSREEHESINWNTITLEEWKEILKRNTHSEAVPS
jgi:hypothetical protein